MKLLLWIGSAPNHRALANKLAEEFEVVGIITESRVQKRKLTLSKILETLFEKFFLSFISKAWIGMNRLYNDKYPNYPAAKRLDVSIINSEEAFEFSKEMNADLVIVSGTSLIKKKMLSVPASKGILNLHTGLSPYIKGGPNCTNWCIAAEQFHLVGNTIMWIDEGIDSGNIVTTELTDIDWNSSFQEIHFKVMEHAHDLYQRAIRYLANGKTSNVPQSEIAEGKTYYTKQWGLNAKMALKRNLPKVKKKETQAQIKAKKEEVKTVEIN